MSDKCRKCGFVEFACDCPVVETADALRAQAYGLVGRELSALNCYNDDTKPVCSSIVDYFVVSCSRQS